MFNVKYSVSILNSKWEVIKRNLKLSVIPRKDEYIFLDDRYVSVVNVIHTLNKKHEIFVIIEDLPTQPENNLSVENQ